MLSTVMDVPGGSPCTMPNDWSRWTPVRRSRPLTDYQSRRCRGRRATIPLPPILFPTETYNALLPRAKETALDEMTDTFAALHAQANRHLQLDRARIEGYSEDLEADLKRQRDRVVGVDEGRRSDADEKLATLHAERQTKLEHLATRYQVRIRWN